MQYPVEIYDYFEWLLGLAREQTNIHTCYILSLVDMDSYGFLLG